MHFKFVMPVMNIQMKISERQLDLRVWNSAVSSGPGFISM